jgi:hypothetical protein
VWRALASGVIDVGPQVVGPSDVGLTDPAA